LTIAVVDSRTLRRAGYALVAATTALAVGGCGPARGTAGTAGPPIPVATPRPAASSTAPAPAAIAWTPACTLLTDSEVLAATGGYDTTIAIKDRVPTETGTDSNGQLSTCRFDLVGTHDHETVSGPAIQFRIEERGAPIYFPPHMGEETVGGLGDAAFWATGSPTTLNVRKADRLYVWAVQLPFVAYHPPAERDQIERAAALALARTVLAKL
jgi:hypothetical protein